MRTASLALVALTAASCAGLPNIREQGLPGLLQTADKAARIRFVVDDGQGKWEPCSTPARIEYASELRGGLRHYKIYCGKEATAKNAFECPDAFELQVLVAQRDMLITAKYDTYEEQAASGGIAHTRLMNRLTLRPPNGPDQDLQVRVTGDGCRPAPFYN